MVDLLLISTYDYGQSGGYLLDISDGTITKCTNSELAEVGTLGIAYKSITNCDWVCSALDLAHIGFELYFRGVVYSVSNFNHWWSDGTTLYISNSTGICSFNLYTGEVKNCMRKYETTLGGFCRSKLF